MVFNHDHELRYTWINSPVLGAGLAKTISAIPMQRSSADKRATA